MSLNQSNSLAGIILCGGKSSRMGSDKALLPVGGEVMLQRVTRIALEVCQPVIVVAAAQQSLPQLATGVRIIRDSYPDRGPLQGIRDGLAELAAEADVAFVTGCDTPLLKAPFISLLASSLKDGDAAVPNIQGQRHPLPAVYRTSLLSTVSNLLQNGQRSLQALVETCKTNELSEIELREADPELSSLVNCNRPDEYEAAIAALNSDS